MLVRQTRPRLATLPAGCPQVTYRGTSSGTIVLRDEFRLVECLGPGVFVGAWVGTTLECDVPSWIRRAALLAYMDLSRPERGKKNL